MNCQQLENNNSMRKNSACRNRQSLSVTSSSALFRHKNRRENQNYALTMKRKICKRSMLISCANKLDRMKSLRNKINAVVLKRERKYAIISRIKNICWKISKKKNQNSSTVLVFPQSTQQNLHAKKQSSEAFCVYFVFVFFYTHQSLISNIISKFFLFL